MPVYLVTAPFPGCGTQAMADALVAGGMRQPRAYARLRVGTRAPTPWREYFNEQGDFFLLDETIADPAWPLIHDGELLALTRKEVVRLPAGGYRVVFMTRASDPALASWNEGRGGWLGESERRPTATLSIDSGRTLARALPTIYRRRGMDVVEVDFDAWRANPEPVFAALAAAGWPIDAARSAAAIKA
jgi:hypothetical protein